MKEYNINTTGVLCSGLLVTIGWPESDEYDTITSLRNKSVVRKWFLDSRMLDIQKNRVWLEKGMCRPKESLLSIRFKKDNTFLGTIGWTNWDLISARACFGRLVIDQITLGKIKQNLPNDYYGVVIDACVAVRDFAMTRMNLEFIDTYLLANNYHAKKINETLGLKEIDKDIVKMDNGINVEILKMQLTRKEWIKIQQKGKVRLR